MKRILGSVLVLAAVVAILSAAAVQANCGSCETKKASAKSDDAACAKACAKTVAAAGQKSCEKSCGAKTAAACAGKSGCDISKKLNLPSLTYRVGDFQTACSKTAEKVAAKNGASLRYVVEGKSHKDQAKAVAALAAAIDKRANDMLQVRFVVGKKCVGCPNAAASLASSKGEKVIYRVAGRDFTCDKKAKKIAERARKAVKRVSMQYKVGDKCVGGPKAAGAMAKSKGEKMQFVVGKKSTPCNIEAKLLMARAKAEAIYAAGAEPAAAGEKPAAAAKG